MSDNPFVVQELRPSSPTGQSTATYQLTKASVHPVRQVGRDSRGFPVVETIPTAAKWAEFLTTDGCINKVPLRTGAVPSNHADAIAYENETLYDLIVDGWIPADLCPYSTKHANLTGGPFAAIPPGERDCGGRPGGCQHLKGIAESRQKLVLENYNRDLARFSAQRDEEYNRMREGIVAGVGEAIAKNLPPASSRASAAQRLKDGKDDA